MSHFEHGITSALRQQRRDTLFAVGVQDVHRAAAWLESEFGADRASIAVLASADQEHGKGATDGWSVRELAAAS